MLILVSTIFVSRVLNARLSLSLVVALFACLTTPQLAAQESNEDVYSAGRSVLESADTNPAAAANGKASIEEDVDIAKAKFQPPTTFTARPQEYQKSMNFSDGPNPPSDLLVPTSPSEQSFTKPITVNDLRSGSGDESVQVKVENDGSEAIGTFATSNQEYQRQPIMGTGNASFSKPPSMTPPPSMQFGDRPQPEVSSRSTINDNFGSMGQSSRQSQGSIAAPLGNVPIVSSTPTVQLGPQSTSNLGGTTMSQPVVRSAMATQPSNSVSSRVQPTGFMQPIQPTTKTPINRAKDLIARYSIDSVQGPLPGEPVKLVDMLRQPIDSSKRVSMVHQYWEAYYDWASYLNAQQYLEWLEQIQGGVSQAEAGMLEAAKLVARNKVLAAEIQLGKSQSGMLQFMPNRSTDLLPLPGDSPLIQKYKTNYDLYRAHRMMPESLRGIDQMLPKTLDLITKRAEAAEVAKSAADQVLAGMRNRQTTLASVLEAGRTWRLAEQDLIASVINYNHAIGDYALNITQGYQTPEKTVAMLIGKPKTTGQVRRAAPTPAQSNPNRVANNRELSSQPFGGQSFGRQPVTSQPPVTNQFGNQADQANRLLQQAGSRNVQANPNASFNPGAMGGQPAGGFKAPAAPVTTVPPSSNSGGGNGFGPQPPVQQPPVQTGERSAQAPFGFQR